MNFRSSRLTYRSTIPHACGRASYFLWGWLVIGLLGLWLGGGGAPCRAETARLKPYRLPVSEPEQITSEAVPVLYGAVSRDGQWLVYASGREEFTDLWLRSADPSVVVLPRRLTSDPADEIAPTFSPDGRYVAYVGTSYDVKGDIYVLDLKAETSKPARLTGRDTEDGFPCFTPDGRTLYFHQAEPG
ncbi:MAG: PD40 domain-containing protein, partial [Desulfobacterales bacterium]